MSVNSRAARPNLEYYKKQVKNLLAAARSGDEAALRRIRTHRADVNQSLAPTISRAQLAIAREEGFPSWPKFKAYIDEQSLDFQQKVTAFIQNATLGDPHLAYELLRDNPTIATANLHTALVTGDVEQVTRLLSKADINLVGGPLKWPPILYVCFTRMARVDEAVKQKLAECGKFLLEHGSDPNCGFLTSGPHPEFESALYGASSVSCNAALTALLVMHGADVNDTEVAYHAPEAANTGALTILVETGKLNRDSLATMLLRKIDWHDFGGVRYLLEHGADPNYAGQWPFTPLHKAVARDNSIETLELLLNHSADPTVVCMGLSVTARAARRGRADFLTLCEKRALPITLTGIEALIAAFARGNAAATNREEFQAISDMGGTLLAEFAGNGNTAGVRRLLDLGIDIAARYTGDGYFNIAEDSTSLHVAAWRARHETVKYLIERGAPVDAVDARGQTPLMLAVRACVDSYWADRRTPESVASLLSAGATVEGIDYPSGYIEVDQLLEVSHPFI